MPPVFLNNEHELLNQLKAGDKRAFTRLYELTSEKLYIKLLRLVKTESVAEEMLQEIFVLIWEKRETIVIHHSFNSYVSRIAENKVFDFFRKLKREENLINHLRLVSINESLLNEESTITNENFSSFNNAINSLPPQRKLVYRLCKVEGKSYNEVSGLLGISPSTINDHIVKATHFIKKEMRPAKNH